MTVMKHPHLTRVVLAWGLLSVTCALGQTQPAGGDVGGISKTGTAAEVAAAQKADAQRAKKKQTLAIVPFIGQTPAEKKLATQMRFAVAQKLSRDGRYLRQDNVEVDDAVSALQITFDDWPAPDDLQKLLTLLDKDTVILGRVVDKDATRTLTLRLYGGANGDGAKDFKLLKEASGIIPDAKESPRLAVEKLLADLVQMRFVARDVEADHSDPEVEKLFTQRPNLVLDPDFELAAKDPKNMTLNWGAILGPNRWHPPVLTLGDVDTLAEDKVAVVPKAAAGVAGAGDGVRGQVGVNNESGYCLLMRMSKDTAENNGLACESTWIPVEDGQRYRFAVRYHSNGPIPRLFLKGFAVAPDQFGDKNDPEAVRRGFYRAQILPRHPNKNWDLIEMDFTPAALEIYPDKKIQWVRIDLYIYLKPGDVFFDHAVIKNIQK